MSASTSREVKPEIVVATGPVVREATAESAPRDTPLNAEIEGLRA